MIESSVFENKLLFLAIKNISCDISLANSYVMELNYCPHMNRINLCPATFTNNTDFIEVLYKSKQISKQIFSISFT